MKLGRVFAGVFLIITGTYASTVNTDATAQGGAVKPPSRPSDDVPLATPHVTTTVAREESKSSSSQCHHPAGGVGLEWQSICCSTRDQKYRPGRQILKRVTGRARPGRLLAIMGPSGSGKTTLLNTLSGQLPYTPYMTLTGSVSVTETEPVKGGGVVLPAAGTIKDKKKGGSGAAGFVFVKQEDLFYSHLTVRETLLFTARLRLPRSMSYKAKEEYVDEMIFRMGLSDVAHTLVGDEKKRGISGGERKRLSLACELMGNPSKIIFADEPTSGLDSFQAQIVMESFKKLCLEGHTVIVSIHQPRSTVYQMFDDIILLSEGNVIYHGEADQVLPYLESLGFMCPMHFNPAEYMLDLVSVDNSSPQTRAESSRQVQRLAAAYQQSSSKGKRSAAQGSGSSKEDKALAALMPVRRTPIRDYMAERSRTFRARAGWFEQFRILISRQWKQTSRDMFTNGVRALSTVALAGLFGSIFWKLGLGEEAIQERSAVLMHTCINTGMIAMVKTLNLFTRERAIVGRERTRRLYDTSAYVLSKVFGELPIDALFPVMFGCILYPMAGLQPGGGRFVRFLTALALQTLTASSLGLTLGSICPSTEAALALGPSLMVVFILLSGQVGTSNSKIPSALRWVQDVSIIRWAFEALCVNEFDGLKFQLENPKPLARLLPFLPKTILVSGQQVLDKLELGPSCSVSRAIAAQCGIMGSNYLLTYLGLRFRAPRFQPLLPIPAHTISQQATLPKPVLPPRQPRSAAGQEEMMAGKSSEGRQVAAVEAPLSSTRYRGAPRKARKAATPYVSGLRGGTFTLMTPHVLPVGGWRP